MRMVFAGLGHYPSLYYLYLYQGWIKAYRCHKHCPVLVPLFSTLDQSILVVDLPSHTYSIMQVAAV